VRSRENTRRIVAALIVLALVVALLLFLAAPKGNARQLPGPCSLYRHSGETIRHLSKRQIRCAVRTFGPVPGGRRRALCIARRESNLIPTASSATGMYLGLYQHAADDWERRYRHWTKPRWKLPDNATRGRTNAIVTIRMVAAHGGWARAGWPVEDC
jgi:hypothetical protein